MFHAHINFGCSHAIGWPPPQAGTPWPEAGYRLQAIAHSKDRPSQLSLSRHSSDREVVLRQLSDYHHV